MKKALVIFSVILTITLSFSYTAFAIASSKASHRQIDDATEQFIYGNWKVTEFLGFQMITKEDVEYPDGEKILGKSITIAANLFSTVDFSPQYNKYAVDIWNSHYDIADDLSGSEFLSSYKVTKEVTGIKDTDKITVIHAFSEDHKISGSTLVKVNNERLLLYLNCDYFELKKNVWSENDMDVAIYDPGVSDDGVYHVEYNNNEAELVPENQDIYLLMVNGGFVPNPDIKIISGLAFVPAKTITEPLGATIVQDGSKTLTITLGSTNISMTVNNTKAYVNHIEKKIAATPVTISGSIYVPLRFAAEELGAKVELVTDLSGGGMGFSSKNLSKISVISVELPQKNLKSYSQNDGLEKVKSLSVEEYQQLTEYLKLSDRNFDKRNYKDYDPKNIAFTGKIIGRYYVYRLKVYPNFNIFFNRYTGEIYSERAGLPILNISKGFINISWLYQ